MPESPNYANNNARGQETQILTQRWLEKASPAEFFGKRSRYERERNNKKERPCVAKVQFDPDWADPAKEQSSDKVRERHKQQRECVPSQGTCQRTILESSLAKAVGPSKTNTVIAADILRPAAPRESQAK